MDKFDKEVTDFQIYYDDIFIKLFNTSAAEIIDGFDRLQYSRLFAFKRKKRYRVINEKSFGIILRIRPKD